MNEKLDIPQEQIPQHIAVIMDGNRRWAESKGLLAISGHNQGAESIKRLLECALEYNIGYVTLYGFSSENWKRPEREVSGLMKLVEKFIQKEKMLFKKHNICVRFIGSEKNISHDLKQLFNKTEKETEQHNRITLTIAFDYGSRAEIVNATQKIAADVLSGDVALNDISENLFERYLDTYGSPPPDLLLRTSGEMRISNFLLWQIAYSELVFQDVYWPDYSKENFDEALRIYARRIRRFGGS